MKREQVSLIRCQDYRSDLVYDAVKSAVELLGGMHRFVSAGQTVLLKTNLLGASTPDKCIVTHPSVVAAVARLVIEVGGKPIIADSPGGPFTRGRLESCYKKAGLFEVAQQTGAVLNFDTRSTQVSHPDGLLMKRLDVIQVLQEVDVVIGLCKLKTHGLLTFTGATKILFGVVPGLTKAGYHAKLPRVPDVAEMLLDIVTYVKPSLMIMDAVVGMEGDGPAAGKPREVGLILASPDSVALDVVATSAIGMEPLSIPTLKAAARRGYSTGLVADVDVLGESLRTVRVPDFKPPATSGLNTDRMPSFLRNFMANQLVVRPQPERARCIGCGICLQRCPVGAITIDGKQAVIDQVKCIRCYCCHEMCPEVAIDLKQSWLASLVHKAS